MHYTAKSQKTKNFALILPILCFIVAGLAAELMVTVLFGSAPSFAENRFPKTDKPAVSAAGEQNNGVGSVGIISVDVGNLRSKPVIDASVIYKLQRGETVTFWQKKGEWFLVTIPDDQVGWAHQSLFTDSFMPSKLAPASTKAKVSVPIGRVREKPSLDAGLKYRLKSDETVSIINEKNDWYLVLFENGWAGWSHKNILRLSGKKTTQASSAIAPDKNKALDPLRHTVEAHAPETSNLDAPTVTGGLSESHRAVEPEKKVILNVPLGRVRQAPSLDAPISFRLEKGHMAAVIDTEGKWLYIRLEDGRTGWSHKRLFIDSPQAHISDGPMSAEIKEIQFIETPEGAEAVTFLLNGYFPPETFSNKAEGPKLICEFPDARIGKDVIRHLKVNGQFIKQIRVGIIQGMHPKIKVVVDLVPLKKYGIRPIFFKDENLFSLIVQTVE